MVGRRAHFEKQVSRDKNIFTFFCKFSLFENRKVDIFKKMVIFLLKKSLFFENRDFFEKKPKNRVNFYPQKMAIFQKK